jgi:hypothetical protein
MQNTSTDEPATTARQLSNRTAMTLAIFRSPSYLASETSLKSG